MLWLTVVGLASPIGVASATAADITVDAKASFLRTSSDAPSRPAVVGLGANGLQSGDTVRIRYRVPAPGFGFVGCSGPFVSDDQVQVLGVFSTTADLLASSVEARVPDAIDAGPDHVTSPTFFGRLSTDIPQDFRITPPAEFTVTIPQGARYLFLGIGDTYYTDNCGNPVVSLEQVDTVVPTITCGSPDDAWHAEDVAISCTAQDAGTGLLDPADASFSLTTNLAANTESADASTNSRSVCDRARNCVTAGPLGPNSVDKKGPAITCTPATFLLGQAGAVVQATVRDSGSGPAVTDVSASADVGSVGAKAVSVTAADRVGNSRTVSCGYEVHYDFGGFLSPVNAPPILNVAKAGSAVPVKFSLKGDQGLNILAPASPASVKVGCTTTGPIDAIEETTTLAAGLRYDAATATYNYVWKTDRAWAGTCRQLSLTLVDDTTHKALFQFE